MRRSVVIASQIDRKTRRSIGFRLCRLRAAVARSRSVAEAAASARGRCTMPPCRCLSCSLVALAVQLVHRWDTPPLADLAVAEVGMCDSATVRDAGPWYLNGPSADTRMRVTRHMGATYPSISEAPSASTCKSRNMLKTPNPRRRSFLQGFDVQHFARFLARLIGRWAIFSSAGYRSRAKIRWVQSSQIYSSSASTASIVAGILLALWISAGSFYFVGQPAMSFTQSPSCKGAKIAVANGTYLTGPVGQ